MGAIKPAGFRQDAKLTEQEAEALTAEIADKLSAAYRDVAPLIVRAFKGRAWVAVGNTSWDEYCRLNFHGPRMLRFTEDQLTELCAEFADEGMSVRAIGSALRIGHATAARKVRKSEREPADVIGLDGRRQARNRERTEAMAAHPAGKALIPLTDLIVALLTDLGEGMTVVQLCDGLKIPREKMAPALCRLTIAGRIEYRRPERRGQFGTYHRTDVE